MVKKLLGPKREGLHPDYERENFERVLAGAFDVERRERLEVRHAAAVLRPPQGRRQPDRPHRSRALMSGQEAAPAAGAGAAQEPAPGPAAGAATCWPSATWRCCRRSRSRQPLFDLLSDNPEFFAARGSTASEIIVFAVLLVLVPPALLLAIELLVGLASERARAIVHLVFIGLLAAVVFVQALKKAIDAGDARADRAGPGARRAGGAGLRARRAGALVPQRAHARRRWCSSSLFLFISPTCRSSRCPARPARRPSDGVERVPVVMIVFDEFPSTSLLDAKGEIDAKRYPGFARAGARTAPGSATRTRSTTPPARRCRRSWTATCPRRARCPPPPSTPTASSPCSARATAMNVSEEATSVCPRDLCEDARLDEPFVDRLTSMTEDLGPGLRARGLAPRDRGATCRRCRRPGASSAATAGAAARRPRPPTPATSPTRARTSRATATTASTSGSTRSAAEQADAQLQARPAAARAVAVPARRAPVPPHGHRADPRDLAPVLQGPGPGATSSSCATCSRSGFADLRAAQDDSTASSSWASTTTR